MLLPVPAAAAVKVKHPPSRYIGIGKAFQYCPAACNDVSERRRTFLPVPLLTACLVSLLEPSLAAGRLCCDVCSPVSGKKEQVLIIFRRQSC